MPTNAGAYWMNPGIVSGLTSSGMTQIPTASETWSENAYCVGQPGTYRIGSAVGSSGTKLACYDYSGAICNPGAPGCGCDYAKNVDGSAKSTPSTVQQQTATGLKVIPSQQSWNCLVCPPPV